MTNLLFMVKMIDLVAFVRPTSQDFSSLFT